jgi:hypothetical protein
MSDIPEEWYGHEAGESGIEVITTYKCSKCGRELVLAKGSYLHKPRWSAFSRSTNDSAVYANEQRKAANAARKAAAKPYSGDIEQCQAATSSGDSRVSHFDRCANKAKFVVEANNDVLAVCGTHARDRYPKRWQPGPSYQGYVQKPGADEQVEERYR